MTSLLSDTLVRFALLLGDAFGFAPLSGFCFKSTLKCETVFLLEGAKVRFVGRNGPFNDLRECKRISSKIRFDITLGRSTYVTKHLVLILVHFPVEVLVSACMDGHLL